MVGLALVGLALLTLGAEAAGADPGKSSWSDEKKKRETLRMYREYKKNFATVPELQAAEVAALLKKGGAVLVDARAPREMKVSMIPGAITQKRYERHRSAYNGKKIIAYCTIGYRSGVLAMALRKRGVKAYNMVGGALMWTHSDLPLVRPSAKGQAQTTRLHVYGATWDLAPSKIKTIFP